MKIKSDKVSFISYADYEYEIHENTHPPIAKK